ncbi:MAG TPA: hypothetical protein VFE05_00815, partial [Longimicrobiaceae bacterium]|jgi:hypothetical protein|nr:hypothetical protein [Longimicrobiaceae bacterium]
MSTAREDERQDEQDEKRPEYDFSGGVRGKSANRYRGETQGIPDVIDEFRPRPRPSESVSIRVPLDALETIKRIAASRDMSVEALLKFYIGEGLRRDIAAGR